MAERFTPRQGEYLAFIHLYITLNKRSPAESDFQAYFRVSAPSVHSMIVSLTNLGLIQRTPGQARSIRLLVPPETLPGLQYRRQAAPIETETIETETIETETIETETPFAARYPNVAFWVKEQGPIELGYAYHTETCARLIREEELAWGGGNMEQTVDEWMQALETHAGRCLEELGLRRK